ncbi:hypothetical protein D3C87_1543340 [compost metagenome]
MPSIKTRPLEGGTTPETLLIRVDLPAPFGPIRPVTSPGLISKLAFSSATSPANFLPRFSTFSVPPAGIAATFCAPPGGVAGFEAKRFNQPRRSSSSRTPKSPSCNRYITTRIATPMPISVRPKTVGSVTKPRSTPPSSLRRSSTISMIIAVPPTAPETVVTPPRISIASSTKVRLK